MEPEKRGDTQTDLSGIDEFINAQLAEWKVPGLSIALVKDGQVILSKGYGYRDVERTLPATDETLYAIGSCSKAFTTMVMGILADEGKLDWDKPVRDYIPWFRLKDPYASERATPRDITCHRTGLPRHDLMWYGSNASREEIIRRVRYLEPFSDMRTKWYYQNQMFITAGYLAGVVAGSTWEDLVRERVFKPLGMEKSNFSPSTSLQYDDCSYPYQETDGIVRQMPHRDIVAAGPAGSIYSNVREMASWVKLHLAKGKLGEQQIVSEAQLAQMHSPQMVVPETPGLSQPELGDTFYGLGWAVQTYRGRPYIWHTGGIDGYSALVALLPADQIGIVILTNLNGAMGNSGIAHHIFDRLLGLPEIDWCTRMKDMVAKMKAMMKEQEDKADAELVPDTKPSLALDAYVGTYSNPAYGEIVVEKQGDGLKATYNALSAALKHFHYDSFELNVELMQARMRVTFSLDDKGQVSKVAAPLEPMVPPIVFDKK